MSSPKIAALRVDVEAGEEQHFTAPGIALRFKEADFGFELSLDNGPFVPFDVGMDIVCFPGDSFKTIGIKNTGPTKANYIVLYGKVKVGDSRLNIVESRNGSAASNTAVATAEFISNADDQALNTWVPIAPYDANRTEIWLWTDAAVSAFWDFEGGVKVPVAARDLFLTPGPKQWLKLETKSAIYVRHTEAGKKVIAQVFTF